MRLQSVTLAAVAVSAPIPMDREANPSTTTLKLTFSLVATAQVEYTLDDIFDPTVTPTWTIAAAPFASGSANATGAFPFAVTAFRLNVTAFTSGTIKLQVLQGKQG
jgi:hypothetical protein